MAGSGSNGNGSTSRKQNGSARNQPGKNRDEGQANERTPLLSNKKDGDNASNGSGSDSSGSDDVAIVSDLGDFTVQPADLARIIADKDIDGLLELGDEGDIFSALQTDQKNGLQQDQCSEEGSEERIRVYGRNKLPEKQMKSFWKFLWEAFNDKVLIILTVAAAVSFALGMYQDFGPQHDPDEPRVQWVEGVAIMTAIVIVTVTSSVNDYSKERQFKALSESKEIPTVKVIRDGKKFKVIKSDEVLVGDLVYIEAGSILTCDGIVISAKHDIKADESDATGESDAITKTPWKHLQSKSGNDGGDSDGKKDKKQADPFLLSGSKILEGEAVYLVLAVGVTSFQGKIFMSLRSSQPDQTKMQKQLAELAEKIAKLASIAGGLLFLCLFIRNCIELKTKPDRTPAEKGQGFIQSFVISVTLIVVAVPEGLPLAVTLALAFATNRMTSNNLLVRVFEACETMSNANVVVTDKTGTLTANEMRVVEGTIGGTAFTLRDEQGSTSDDDEEQHDDAKDSSELMELLKKNETLRDIFAQSIAINSTAFEEHKEENKKDQKKDQKKGHRNDNKKQNGNAGNTEDEQKEGPTFVGNKTESALLQLMEVQLADVKKQSFSDIREKCETVLMLPFNSSRKAMAVAAKVEDGKYRLFVKGAAEVIVGLCTHRAKLEGDGKDDTEELDEDKKQDVQKLVDKYATRSLRTIALAYRDFEEWPPAGASQSGEGDDEGKIKYEDIAKDLILLAIPGIEDPLRQGVVDAVGKCHIAGVSVKMCTGDNLLTAKAIATQCGIYKDDGLVISGSDWRALSEEEQREKAPKLQVMARSLPQDKEALVKALQDAGQIVGVTGDGTNDALALKTGDVGFSMGQSGTEVAKEASDVIIMDDNFASLVGAISWGRCVSDAVRKFLQFQLAVNATAIVITFVSSVTGGDENSVMNAVQLLWVNLIMDTFAALALATDPADDSLLRRKPEPRASPIISVAMTKMIVIQAAYQISITLALHFIGPKALGPITKSGQEVTDTQFGTLVFNVFVWCQIFNMINCRKLDNGFNVFSGLYKNLWMLGILGIMIGGQILIVFFGGAAFDTTPISPAYWAVSIALGAGSLIVGALVRLIPDNPIGQVMIKLGIMPDLDSLPRTRPRHQDGSSKEQYDGEPYQFIQSLRNGRHKANKNFYTLLHPQRSLRNEAPKDVLKGLVIMPAMAARAVAGQVVDGGR